MAFSMTGFGRCLLENPLGRQQWEIRSLNGRFLDLKWHLPKYARHWEYQLDKIVRRHAGRGRIEISLELQLNEKYAPAPALDGQMARNMLSSIKNVANSLGNNYVPDYNFLLIIPELWQDCGLPENSPVLKYLEEGLAFALQDWNGSRESEGAALADDLLRRIDKMQDWLEKMKDLAPEVIETRQNRLKIRIDELLANEDIDAGRVNQELVIIGDRLDSSEELTRLTIHLQRLRDLLINSDSDLGKRMDFTLQECFREINTCGNKLPSASLSHIIVDFKNELEKCREQAMNLE